MKTKEKRLYPKDLIYNVERKFYPEGLWYTSLHLPTDDELSTLNLSKEDGEFVFVKNRGSVKAYITKSSHSKRCFLNLASPIMTEKKLVADVRKENNLWKGNYYYGDHVRTVWLKEDYEYFSLLNELFSDAEILLSHGKKSCFRPLLWVIGMIISVIIALLIILALK